MSLSTAPGRTHTHARTHSYWEAYYCTTEPHPELSGHFHFHFLQQLAGWAIGKANSSYGSSMYNSISLLATVQFWHCTYISSHRAHGKHVEPRHIASIVMTHTSLSLSLYLSLSLAATHKGHFVHFPITLLPFILYIWRLNVYYRVHECGSTVKALD